MGERYSEDQDFAGQGNNGIRKTKNRRLVLSSGWNRAADDDDNDDDGGNRHAVCNMGFKDGEIHHLCFTRLQNTEMTKSNNQLYYPHRLNDIR